MTIARSLPISSADQSVEPGEPGRGSAEERRIFLLPRHPTSWSRLLEQAKIMAREPDLRPVMVLANRGQAQRAAICRESGIDFLDVSEKIEGPLRAQNKRLDAVLGAIDRRFAGRERIIHSLPVSLLRLAQTRRRFRVEYAVLAELCRREAPAAILVPGDRELSPVPPMLRVGLDLDIPTILGWSGVPYGEGLVLSRAPFWRFRVSLGALPPLLNLYVARRYPRQVRDTKYGKMLFSPGWLTLAMAAEGMLSANPWMQGGGNSRYVLHHSRRRMQHFLDKGVPEGKSILIGDSSVDALHAAYEDRERIRAELVATHNLRPDIKLIVVSVPNDFEHDVCDWPAHFARMDHFLGRLAGQGAEILLSLHPKSKEADYRPIAERYGFHFARQPLSRILPAADLFVCSGSSTILWASLCGVPSINLDYLDLDLADFKHPGIVTVGTAHAFEAALRRFLAEGMGPEYGDLAGYAASVRADSRFDGKAGERMCDFLRSLPVCRQQAA